MRWAPIALVLLLACAPAWAQQANVKTDCSTSAGYSANGGHPPTQDRDGNACVVARPAGSNGTDYSANAETVTFGGGPSYTPAISGYSVVATLPATPSRAGCQVMNRSANQVLEVWDDGAGNSATVFALASGGSVGAQGGADNCSGFKGRITVMSTSSSDRVAVRQW